VEAGTHPSKISSVFCSQAVVLAMRECIQDSPWLGSLLGEIRALNSRLCSPADLHRVFLPHSREMPNSYLDDSGAPAGLGGGIRQGEGGGGEESDNDGVWVGRSSRPGGTATPPSAL
jgi:hypothetical protein